MNKYKYTNEHNSNAYLFAMSSLFVLVIVYGGVTYAKFFTEQISPMEFSVFNLIVFLISFGFNIYVWKEYKADLLYANSPRMDPGNEGVGIARVVVVSIVWFFFCFFIAGGYAILYMLALIVNGYLKNERILKVKNGDKYFDGEEV